jgi:hypothetical protein
VAAWVVLLITSVSKGRDVWADTGAGAGNVDAALFTAGKAAPDEAFGQVEGWAMLVAAGLGLALTCLLLIWSSRIHRRLEATFQAVTSLVDERRS